MLLIGTFEWASTKLRGVFNCPTCGSPEEFRLKSSRPFLTLYFIPIIPIGGLHEYVKCSKCKDSFEPAVLSATIGAIGIPSVSLPLADGDNQAATFEEDLLSAMAICMVEDGQVTETEIRVAQTVFERITEQAMPRARLGGACSDMRARQLTISSFLATAMHRRDADELRILVQAIFAVSGADGRISPRRMQGLLKAQEVLGMETRDFQGAIESADQWLE